MIKAPHIATVVVDVSLDRQFDYVVPEELRGRAQIGSRVTVPFGHRSVDGYIVSLSDRSAHPNLKEIKKLIGDRSLLTPAVMKLSKWMAEYYSSSIEQALKTVLPGAVRDTKSKFKSEKTVVPTELASAEMELAQLRKRAPKQALILDLLIAEGEMSQSSLIRAAKTSASVLTSLEKKGLVKVGRQKVLRDPFAGQTILRTQPLPLMPQQATALESIKVCIDTGKLPVVLLHGVTGSGKTEVYIQAIQYTLDQGRGAIVLVPEIALTPQMVERFFSRFGDVIAVLHSNLSTGERHDEWHRIRGGEARIAIGARSALFAPVENLGLIVVDEEHEHTYKQEEMPRYNARDVAVMRGHMEKCAVVLGSATPSVESYQNALAGKYHLSEMPARVDHKVMPSLRVIDMRIEKEKTGRVSIFSTDLIEAIRLRLSRAEQVILFLNRRGYSTSLTCPTCGHVIECESCSVSMTYHKTTSSLHCHLCGAGRRAPDRCPNPECRDTAIRYSGLGTQKVEEIVKKLFPKAGVARMDSDTTGRKGAHAEILSTFRDGSVDILIGTQMIAKGLHFPNVTLVGVINADTTLHMPDFRAGERTFQLITQVAGRAGRGDVAGEVLVQTYTPFNEAIQAARRMDYEGFIDQDIEFRRELRYPPFSHLVCILIRGEEEQKVSASATAFFRVLEKALPEEIIVTSPVPAPIARMKGKYRYQITIRCQKMMPVSKLLKAKAKELRWPSGVSCQIDVDALSLM